MRRALLVLAVAVTAACTPRLDQPVKAAFVSAVPEHTEVRLALEPIADRRPDVERAGRSVAPHASLQLVVFSYWRRVGNEVYAASLKDLKLDEALRDTLRLSKVATLVGPGDRPHYTLHVEVEHIYVSQNLDEYTVLVMGYGGTQEKSTTLESTVVLRLRLSGPLGEQLWEERVTATVLRSADPVTSALSLAASRVAIALETLAPSQNDAAADPQFVVECLAADRSTLVQLIVDPGTERAVRMVKVPAVDPGHARPGEWLLARTTPRGTYLSDAAYAALVRSLAPRFDLRVAGDARRVRFLGVRGPTLLPQTRAIAPTQ